jgi:predicted dienelactone hydrolase
MGLSDTLKQHDLKPVTEDKYASGLASFRVPDADGSIGCALWYPTQTTPQALRQGVYDFHVAKNADCIEGRHPLIIMSHGSGGTRYGHCKTAEFLSSHGYIVLAPEHPKNNFFDDSGVGSAQTYQNRSRHLKSCLDHLLHDQDWQTFIDPDRIGVFGFSLGGFTALTAVGARPFVDGLRHHLRFNREFDPIFTGYEVIVRDGYEESYLPVHFDPRYKACIALAPVSGGLFPKESLIDIKIPVQIFRAERDQILRNPFHAQEIRENLSTPCDFHVIEKAGHFSFLSPVRDDVKATLGELANDDPVFNRKKEHDKMHQLMLVFLNISLS